METLSVTIEGAAPLLMHNGQLADPMNEHTRALSDAVKNAKKSKTDAAWEAVYKAEFLGGLYLDSNHEPCVPGELLEALIIDGAKKSKQGTEAKTAIFVDGNFALEYKGPRKVDEMWKANFYRIVGVRVGKNRVMRCRPQFTHWRCSFNVTFNREILNRKDLIKFITKAGEEVGLCDWRPRFGRFTVLS